MKYPEYLTIEKGNTSFCDNHGTRYWLFKLKNAYRKLKHEIYHYDNDIKGSKKFHCLIIYPGCIAPKSFDTNNFKEAIIWTTNHCKKQL